MGGVVLAGLALFSAGTATHYQSLLISPRYVPYSPLLADLTLTLEWVGLWLVGWEVAVLIVCTVVALMIVVRRANEPMAYSISLTLFFIGFSLSYAVGQLDPWLGAVVITVGFCFLIIPPNLFPDGRHIPRWTRFTTIASIPYFLLTLPLQVTALDVSTGANVPEVYGLATLGMMSLVALVLVGQLQRYRRHADAVQRQQTKHVMMGIAVGMVLEVAAWLTTLLPDAAHPYTAPDRTVYTYPSLIMMLLAAVLHALARMSIALGLGLAMLRARLGCGSGHQSVAGVRRGEHISGDGVLAGGFGRAALAARSTAGAGAAAGDGVGAGLVQPGAARGAALGGSARVRAALQR